MDFENKLLEPYDYLTEIPAKKIRTKLIKVSNYLTAFNKSSCKLNFKSFNQWLNVPEEKHNQITEIIEMLHYSSLL